MFARNNWYCAARSTEIAPRSVVGRTIIKQKLAIFRDAQGAVHALDAMCPHRGGDLSKGECVDGALQCPWHGWRFDGSGECVEIPSLGEEGKIPNLAKVDQYPVHEAQGIVYVWMNPAQIPDWLPHKHEFLDARYHHAVATRFQEGIFIHTLETAIEDSHVAFAHSKSIGAPAWDIPGGPKLPPIVDVRESEDGRSVFGTQKWPADMKGKPGLKDRLFNRCLLGTEEELLTLDKEYRVDITGLISHHLQKADGHKLVVYAFVTPVDEFNNMFFPGAVDTNPDRSLLSNALYMLFRKKAGSKVAIEDVDIITSALTQRFPGGHPKPIFVNADHMGLAFRRMYGRAVQAEGETPAWPVVSSKQVA